ncbi:hypothetical protein M3O40_20170, partial [Xanthomonas nasturtii]|nr:hypothetical protein [Xanthomonas nasturtii]MCL1505359.1 hypothetical protein [Xanthomonas nasturtii]
WQFQHAENAGDALQWMWFGGFSGATHYRQQVAHKRPLPGPHALRERLDVSLARVGKVPAGAHRDDALLGLIGLRYSLFAQTVQRRENIKHEPSALAPLPSGR